VRIDPELAERMADSIEVTDNVEYLFGQSVPLTREQMKYISMLRAEHKRLTRLYEGLNKAA
jgi:hypothetical protein